MLKIKDWVIDADNCCYIVGKQKQRKNKDGNDENYIARPKYYSKLSQAFEYILDAEKRDIVGGSELGLKEALLQFEKANNEFRELFRQATGEREV